MTDVFERATSTSRSSSRPTSRSGTPTGFNTTERNAALREKHPGKFIVNTRFDPRDGDAGLAELEANVERYGTQGRQALHGRVERGLARLEARATRRRYRSSTKCVRSSGSRTSTSTRARRSGRWTRTPSTSPTSTTPRPTSRSSTSSSSTSACRGSRTSASWRRRSRNVYAGPLGRHRRASCTPGRGSSPRSWASCCSGSARTRCRSAPTTDLGAEVAGRGLRRLGLCPTTPTTRTTRGSAIEGKKKILGLNAAKLYGIEVPDELRAPTLGPGASRRRAATAARRGGAGHSRQASRGRPGRPATRSAPSTTQSSTSR